MITRVEIKELMGVSLPVFLYLHIICIIVISYIIYDMILLTIAHFHSELQIEIQFIFIKS